MKFVLHAEKLVAFVLIDRRQRHPGPGRHDFIDVLPAHLDRTRARLDVELLPHVLEVLASDHLLLLEELSLLEVLLGGRALHLFHRHADVAVDIAQFLAEPGPTQFRARAGLVQQIDRLVR